MEEFVIFNPTQFQEFGMSYTNGEEFSYRYQESVKAFWKSIYIPFGPIFTKHNGIKNFLESITQDRFRKYKVDLPLIIEPDLLNEVKEAFISCGFKQSDYIQDEETFLVTPDTFHLKSKYMRYVRNALKEYEITVQEDINEDQLESIYLVYLESADRIGFAPKTIDAFRRLQKNCLISLAINKNTHAIDGYVFGYKAKIGYKDPKVFLTIVFTGTKQEARKSQLGYPLHYELFKSAFENYHVDYIDFNGASRTNSRSYTEFKQCFGGNFINFAGSFEKTRLL